MCLVQRKMSNAVDVRRLIAEVHKRPGLWDFRHEDYKGRSCVPRLWHEVAQNVGIDVVQCKRKWKNLRDAYRAEVKRSAIRRERDKLLGVYLPNNNYNSKWIYFPSLTFISESKQHFSYSIENESTSSNSNDNNHYDDVYNDSMYDENAHKVGNIKLEPTHDLNNDLNLVGDDDETANDKLFEEFQNIATPQAARRLSATFLMNNTFEQHFSPQQVDVHPSTSNAHKCQCPERDNEKVHFLQDLCREEKKLMKSTRQDITRSNKLDHIGDSDYNFLVSFLPQMKKMTEMQNLKFRAKMCDTVLNILTPTVIENTQNNSPRQPCTTHEAVNDKELINIVHSTS